MPEDKAPDRGTSIRVLIVDDSPSMRRLIRLSLEHDPQFVVVAEAANARQARDAVNELAPDVMTLDVEMPEMDGLEFLRRLMKARPMPVVMVSTLTDRGSEAAVRALSLGAVECVAKPRKMSGIPFPDLPAILRMAAKAQVRTRPAPARAPVSKPAGTFRWNGKCILIGASTGGVEALETLLSEFPVDCPPTLITQHMPAQFLVSFSARLNRASAPEVRLAREGDALRPGLVLIAPGGETHLVLARERRGCVSLMPGPKRSGHRPSVDELFQSAQSQATDVVAAILTGMGADGAEGMARLKAAGAYCVAQDKASSIVYGMPRMAVEKGGVDESLALPEIARHLLDVTSEPTPIGRMNHA